MTTNSIQEGTLLWKPSHSTIENANLSSFMKWLSDEKKRSFSNYDELWQWSVNDTEHFWEVLCHYFDIKFHTPYSRVLSDNQMPDVRWFEGATLNFTEHVFRMESIHPALMFQSETQKLKAISWAELRQETASLSNWLKKEGVNKGDRVAAYVPNIPHAFSSVLATASIGAVWSSCSPDFGADSVIERFSQIEPTVLIAVDGYHYGGKKHDRIEQVNYLLEHLPSVKKVILIPYLNEDSTTKSIKTQKDVVHWKDTVSNHDAELICEPVDFSHPLWVLYSSGTTGLPKPIVHSQGGILLEHLKYMEFHANVKPGDRFFWYSTTGWMMWNVVLSALLRGATALVYDGSPGYPDMKVVWKFAQDTKMTTFGTSAAYITSCMKAGLTPAAEFDLAALKSVGSTGSPLPPEGFKWVYEQVGNQILLNSTSGGTDICSSFVGGNPLLPVHAGEIQCRLLGCEVQSFNEDGIPVENEVGEMVITKPMPSMPVYFWNDAEKKRYRESYFEMFPGVWRHGDWIKITPKGSCIIYGRSDATLNKMGVRIGTSEIYRAVEAEISVADSLIISIERSDGSWFMPLFVKLRDNQSLTESISATIKKNIRERISPRFIPDTIIQVEDIPYTLSGKKLEKPIKRIFEGASPEKVISLDALRNPESVQAFIKLAQKSTHD